MTHINLETGPKPRLDWVDVKSIRIDENYQRSLKKSRVAQILRDFDWAHFQPVMLAEHPDGTFTVYDGQHRVEAVRQHPKISAVPAAIVAFRESWQEAGAFIGVNVNRSQITNIERYYAGLEAGDADMMAVCAVLEEAGCEVVEAGRYLPAPNKTAAVSSVNRAIKTYGHGPVTRACQTLRQAWPKDARALNGSLIVCLSRLFRHNKTMTVERMAEKLVSKNRAILTGDAEAMRKIGGGRQHAGADQDAGRDLQSRPATRQPYCDRGEVMNPLHPLIEDLASAADRAGRAAWLLSCPAGVLMTYADTIRNRLHNAGFPEGVAYLEAELARYRAVRQAGEIVKDNPLRPGMAAIADFRPFEPPASPTDL